MSEEAKEQKNFLQLAIVCWRSIQLPLLAIILEIILFYAANFSLPLISSAWQASITTGLLVVFNIVLAGLIYWLSSRLLDALQPWWLYYLQFSTHPWVLPVIKFFGMALRLLLLLALVSFVMSIVPVPNAYVYLLNRILNVVIIIVLAWMLIQLVNLAENLILLKYSAKELQTIAARSAQTQLIVLKRIIVGTIVVLAIGCVLLLFDNVREVGASMLASAGIAGVVVGIAAQKSLNSLVLGLQIAWNQPIKINDWVVLEGEFGQIEEITLYYVVVKIWDFRRLIVPIQYFVEKPFYNLSRTSTNLLAVIFLYMDYSLPIEKLRQALVQIMPTLDVWDKNFYVLHVSNVKEFTIELRVLASATDPSNAWDVGCAVREALITFIQQNYPASLPHMRIGAMAT